MLLRIWRNIFLGHYSFPHYSFGQNPMFYLPIPILKQNEENKILRNPLQMAFVSTIMTMDQGLTQVFFQSEKADWGAIFSKAWVVSSMDIWKAWMMMVLCSRYSLKKRICDNKKGQPNMDWPSTATLEWIDYSFSMRETETWPADRICTKYIPLGTFPSFTVRFLVSPVWWWTSCPITLTTLMSYGSSGVLGNSIANPSLNGLGFTLTSKGAMTFCWIWRSVLLLLLL